MNQTSNPFEKVKTTLNELITHKKTQKEALEMQLKQRENGYIDVICIEIKDAKTGKELEFNPNQTFSDNFFKLTIVGLLVPFSHLDTALSDTSKSIARFS